MSRIPFLVLAALLGAPGPAAVAGDAGPPDWADVGPIFAERCVNCHSAVGAGLGLRLDSYAAALAGSEKGAVRVPGAAARSELIRRLRGESRPRMPFLSYPLEPEQIDLIARWIDAGLPEGAGEDPAR